MVVFAGALRTPAIEREYEKILALTDLLSTTNQGFFTTSPAQFVRRVSRSSGNVHQPNRVLVN